jgi:hypothetical protein
VTRDDPNHDGGQPAEPAPGPAVDESSRPWAAPDAPAGAPPSTDEHRGRPRPAEGGPAPATDTGERSSRRAEPVGDLPVPFAPMTSSSLLDGAFGVIKRRPRAVLGAAAVLVVPVQIVGVYLQRAVVDADDVSNLVGGGPAVPGLGGGTIMGALVAGLLQSFLLFLLGGVVAVFVSSWYGGGEVDGRQALGAMSRHLGAFAMAWLILTPLKIVSYALCILPLAVTTTFFALTAPAIVIEGLGPIAGIKRSAQLVSRQFWRCLGIVLLSALVESVLQNALTIIPTLVALVLPDPLDWMVLAAGQSAAALVTLTALVAVSVLLYLDLRIRTEALDVELRAREAFAAA